MPSFSLADGMSIDRLAIVVKNARKREIGNPFERPLDSRKVGGRRRRFEDVLLAQISGDTTIIDNSSPSSGREF